MLSCSLSIPPRKSATPPIRPSRNFYIQSSIWRIHVSNKLAKVMKETLNTVRVGLFFLLGLAVIWVVYEALNEGAVFRAEGFPVNAPFGDVKMLRTGDDVRVS